MVVYIGSFLKAAYFSAKGIRVEHTLMNTCEESEPVQKNRHVVLQSNPQREIWRAI